MGLDMYLIARKYISGWRHEKNPAVKAAFDKMVEASGLLPTDIAPGSPSGNIELRVGYWRKANAIHAWFVKHVQNGEDECEPHGVDPQQLVALLETCRSVLQHKGTPKAAEMADAILPPQAGFFFGSTEVDDWYWEGITETIEMLERITTNARFADWAFIYQSSW
jgi:hypothetical protein